MWFSLTPEDAQLIPTTNGHLHVFFLQHENNRRLYEVHRKCISAMIKRTEELSHNQHAFSNKQPFCMEGQNWALALLVTSHSIQNGSHWSVAICLVTMDTQKHDYEFRQDFTVPPTPSGKNREGDWVLRLIRHSPPTLIMPKAILPTILSALGHVWLHFLGSPPSGHCFLASPHCSPLPEPQSLQE